MKKFSKKALSMLMALAMIFTMGLSVSAEGETMEIIANPQSIYDTTENFTLAIRLNADVTELMGAAVAISYDNRYIALSDGNGTALTAWDTEKALAAKLPSTHTVMFGQMDTTENTTKVTITVAKSSPTAANLAVTDGKIDVLTLNFKPVAAGTTTITADTTSDMADTYFSKADGSNIFPAYTPASILIQQMPNKPSIIGATVGGTLKSGEKATANYTWNNGNKEGTTADLDASVINWTVGGEAVTKADTDGRLELTLTDDMVGKKLAYTVVPKADRDASLNNNVTEAVPSEESAVVMPADTYAPTATVSLEKVTIGKEVELNYTVNTYEVGEEAPTFAWYVMSEEDAKKVLEAKDIAAAEKATAMEGDAFTKANPTFEKTIGEGESEMELKGMWAVVKVTAKETVAEATYPLEGTEPNVYYAAAEIKAKKTGGTTQTGASLVTGGNTVVTPEKPGTEDPEKPGTEEPGTDVPGTEEPAGSEDPAGTANENGAAAFTDVNKEAYAWAYDSIDVLAKAGVIKGMSETTFGPELTTTNAQVIALAVRIAGLTAEEGATTDKVDAEHWVAGEMAIAEANEILGVYGDKVDVEGETTREIAFTLLYNALKAAGVELEETAEAIEFTDAASISEGCAEAIDALVKAGIVNGMGDGTLAPKATLTRAQLAKILGLANALIK